MNYKNATFYKKAEDKPETLQQICYIVPTSWEFPENFHYKQLFIKKSCQSLLLYKSKLSSSFITYNYFERISADKFLKEICAFMNYNKPSDFN